MNQPLRIGIIAGEMSGDTLGADLIKSIRQRIPDVECEGIGGAQMIAAGFVSHIDQERLAVMGLFEVLRRLPELLSIRKSIRQHFLDDPPDLFIGIDSPDFNLPLEQVFKRANIPTVHYVSPSVWAWRQKRVRKIAQSVDLMLALLPFEADFYKEHDIPVEFVGHPLADKLPLQVDVLQARERLGFSEDDEVVALLPGSRASEVEMLGEVFLATAELLAEQRPQLKFVIPAANEKRQQKIAEFLRGHSKISVKLIVGQSHQAMAAADVVLMASGTTTLEAMLLKKPMVVAYRFKPLTDAILSRLVKTPFVALPNILAKKMTVPEILHQAVNAESLAKAVLHYFDNPQIVTELKQEFLALHQQLQRNASDNAANAVLKLIERES